MQIKPDFNSRPVSNVSWYDAHVFAEELSKVMGRTFRLPTEAEWEYACRAGTTTMFYWGDDPSPTAVGNGWFAWYDANSGGQVQEAGSKEPNAWNARDMIGNVFEWCEDDWVADYTDAPNNGRAQVDSPRGDYRILRGNSALGPLINCRSAMRFMAAPTAVSDEIGFRIVMEAQ